jgi:hypothetical protein
MKLGVIILIVLTCLTIISQVYFAMITTETQTFRIIKTERDFEIRVYPAAIIATISMEAKTYKELSSTGFKKLSSYIFGSNESKKSIGMTSPVYMDINDSLSSMSFVMPANYSTYNLPKPNDSAISISTTNEEYVAAFSFGGYANDDKIKLNANKLASALKANGVDYYGNFRFLGYNPPYQFWGRKNEIIVNIHWNDK